MENGTAIEAIGPSAILSAGHDPEKLALATFLARYRNPKTRANYAIDLKCYMRFCMEQHVGMLDVERGHLELYIEHLQNLGLAPATVSRRFGTVYLFLEFAEIDDRIPKNPAKKVDRPKVDSDAQSRPFFEIGEIHAIITRCRRNLSVARDELTYATRPDSQCWQTRRDEAERRFRLAQRDYTLLHLMSSTGMRVGSVCALDIESLHFDTGSAYLEFIRKGGKLTRKTLPMETMLLLREHIGNRTSGPMFLNSYSNRITRHNVACVIDRLAHQVGIDRHVPPHGLRRTFATTAHQLGATNSELQASLDHADPRTTALYVRKGDGGAAARLKVAGLLSA